MTSGSTPCARRSKPTSAERDDSIYDDGASVAMTIDGELVIDLWGGTADRDAGPAMPWERDTIINVWSTTKTVSALACLILADQGELDLYAPVAKVWPEFAAGGKGGIEVRHLMSHTAGLSGWQTPIDGRGPLRLGEGDVAARRPGAVVGAGHGVGLPRRDPGLPRGRGRAPGDRADDRRVRRQGDHRPARRRLPHRHGRRARRPGRPRHPAERAAVGRRRRRELGRLPHADRTRGSAAEVSATIPWRRAEIPAAGGHGNARSVAMIHAPMACGGEANGVRLLSPKGIDVVFDEQSNGVDLVLGVGLRHGIGFGLPSPDMPVSPNERACFWGGWGGSLAIVDLDARMTFSYVMNKMGEGTVGDIRGAGLLLAAYMSLGLL